MDGFCGGGVLAFLVLVREGGVGLTGDESFLFHSFFLPMPGWGDREG